MIPRPHLLAWQQQAPQPFLEQTEQDLIISRILIEIYKNPYLADHLVFRGGTALTKLFAGKALRYSEDIDLVQIHPGPIGEIFQHLDDAISPWLGKYQWKQSIGRVTLYFNFEPTSFPGTKRKIKIEINTREHFHVYDLVKIPYAVESSWFKGETAITVYTLEELLGTKLRALYQRKKGRDLFDLYMFLSGYTLEREKIIGAFTKYMAHENRTIQKTDFQKNLSLKIKDSIFLNDMQNLVIQPELYDIQKAYTLINDALIAHLPSIN